MDGDSKPYFRRHCNDFPQDTQLFGWYLSHHHWHNGYYRVHQQVKMSLVHGSVMVVGGIVCVIVL
jgi:hypothetical protein